MHNLFLGELRHHCRDVWGVNDVKEKPTTKATPHTPAEQAEWLTHLVTALREAVSNGALVKGALSAVTKPRKGYLVALAQANGIVPDSKPNKQSYGAALLNWVQMHSVDTLIIPPVLPKPTSDFHLASNADDIAKFRVLTPEVVETLRADILSTYLPSWIERPPANFGSAAHGKLKADHWRTVCTINMVITLVRVWSASTATAGDRKVLENFIHLVVAVDLAARRSIDPERARLYDHHMMEYLRTLRELFDHNLVPNHHLSLHLTTCLLLFGPVRGWWGYPFERYNGIIQRLNTNNHIAQIPLTFMRLFYAGAELRWLMSSMEWPDSEEFRDVLDSFRKTYQDAARGSRVLDIFSSIPTSTDTANESLKEMYAGLSDSRLDNQKYLSFVGLIRALYGPEHFIAYHSDLEDPRSRLSPHVRTLTKLEIGRVTYGTRANHIRNSFVCFRDPSSGNPTLVHAGQISQIFLHSRIGPDKERIVQSFVVIDEYIALTDEHAGVDPYLRFPQINTRLYYDRFHSQPIIVRSSDLVSHFAAYFYVPEGIKQRCVVVRSLDRVRCSFGMLPVSKLTRTQS
ncbi:hypothetical protein C2E23DRAFT_915053 [Lenzites betulinus]|nr:hypothetical protein C2E23DRAFT_915053 [Lenzites betulinus]